MLDTDGDIDMDGLMLFSLFVGVVALTLLYVWLVMHAPGRWRWRTCSRTRVSTRRSPPAGRGGGVDDRGDARHGRRRIRDRQLRDHVRRSRALALRIVRRGSNRSAHRRRRQVLDLT